MFRLCTAIQEPNKPEHRSPQGNWQVIESKGPTAGIGIRKNGHRIAFLPLGMSSLSRSNAWDGFGGGDASFLLTGDMTNATDEAQHSSDFY